MSHHRCHLSQGRQLLLRDQLFLGLFQRPGAFLDPLLQLGIPTLQFLLGC